MPTQKREIYDYVALPHGLLALVHDTTTPRGEQSLYRKPAASHLLNNSMNVDCSLKIERSLVHFL